MLKIAIVAVLALATVPAMACDEAQLRLLKDQVRALEKQARSLERLERIERDRDREQRFERNRRS